MEVELAQHPDLVRYYAPGSVEHLAFDLLAEHDRQAVPLLTVGEAVQRARRLADHADAIDPFYAFGVRIQPAAVTVTARPKDQNAPPLHGSVSFKAEPGSPEAAAVDDFMTYGLPLTVGAGDIADVQLSLPEGMKDLLPDNLAAERLSLGPRRTRRRSGRARGWTRSTSPAGSWHRCRSPSPRPSQGRGAARTAPAWTAAATCAW